MKRGKKTNFASFPSAGPDQGPSVPHKITRQDMGLLNKIITNFR